MTVFRLLWRHRALIAVLVRRDLDARYRASVLGFFWSLINPLLLLAVYAVVFTYIFSPRFPGGDPYPLFLFSGLLPWLFFSGAVLDGSATLIDNGAGEKQPGQQTAEEEERIRIAPGKPRAEDVSEDDRVHRQQQQRIEQ